MNLPRRKLAIAVVGLGAAAIAVTIALGPHRAGAAPVAEQASDIVATAPGWIDVAGGTRHLGARSDGIIEQVLVHNGDSVAANALLIRFDGRQTHVDAQLAELEVQRIRQQQSALDAQIGRARRQIARLQPLVAAQAEPADPLNEQQQALQQLQAQAALARIDAETAQVQVQAAHDKLARLELHAPGSGRVLRVAVHPGEAVASGSELVWFAADGPLIVRAELDERLFGTVRDGMAARISPEYDEGRIYPAHVIRVAESVGPVLDLPDVRAAAKDDRVVECDLELDATAGALPPLLIGQRMLVRIRAAPPPGGQ